MLTAAITNKNLSIYSPSTITGINTNYLYVFDNNVFRSISTFTISGSTANIVLSKSAEPDNTVKIQLYTGGVTTASGSFSTAVINVTNNTQYEDNSAPSLIEIIESNNYNFTSFVFSNFITGISTQSNFPSANLTLKRQPPTGKITINEGYLGPMRVHRFAAISSTVFTLDPVLPFFSRRFCAFDYNAYGDHDVESIKITITPVANNFPVNFKLFLTINQDYFGRPSQVPVGASAIVDLSEKETTEVEFVFNTPVSLRQGAYWFIVTPAQDSNIGTGNQYILNYTSENNYTTRVLFSDNGITYTSSSFTGVGFSIKTNRGIVLASVDAIFNQLMQPQADEVVYGDVSDYSTYTELAKPINAHLIQKQLVDDAPQVYAVETLIDSAGQNQYQVLGVGSFLYSMIANPLTTNIVRYDFYSPQNLSRIELSSLGDYYTKGPQGTVLVSATDFIGVSTVEISNSSSFPENSTTVINLPNAPQLYIDNVSYDFGDLGRQFLATQANIGQPIKAIFAVSVGGNLNYLLISEKALFLYDLISARNIYSLSNAIFTSYVVGTNGILITDSLRRVYSVSEGNTTLLGTVEGIPTASATQLTTSYIGVSTLASTSSVQSRRRIYAVADQTITHLTWSTQIPEPQITFINTLSFGILIGAYDQSKSVGKLYLYYNSVLTLLYQTYLRPDTSYYSNNTSRVYVALSGSQIISADFKDNKLGNFTDTGISIDGTFAKQMASAKDSDSVVVITNQSTFTFEEANFVTTRITSPGYSVNDPRGALTNVQINDLRIQNYESTNKDLSFNNINFDPLLNGYTSTFTYSASGYIVYDDITSSLSTTFYLQYPTNSTLNILKLNGQNITLDNNTFSAVFQPKVPQEFALEITGRNVSGIGTIALRTGIASTGDVVGISSFIPPKTINWYYKTGGEDDLYGFEDGVMREADTDALTANVYTVYARFSDIYGNRSGADELASDIIYNQNRQQANNQALPSGKIVQINPSAPSSGIIQYVPPEGASAFIYAGSKISRSFGTFESDPYFASDVVAWGQLQVLALIPGATPSSDDYGTAVTLYVKTANSLSSLLNKTYTNSYKITTINNGNDFSSSYASILANLNSFTGRWIQFKIVLESATAGLTPQVQSALITYTGAAKSFFVTKTFDTKTQSTIRPAAKIRRGILTANFVTNGGELVFGYTTDPLEGNPANYVAIEPNQIFTLASPSETIKFGVIIKTATDNPAFLDEFAVQLDLGPNDLYFMPPQAAFEIEQYKDPITGIGVQSTYQFINKTIGIVSSYNWSFGTSIITPINSTLSTVFNSQDPIIAFAGPGTYNIGLLVTGWVEANGTVFNSEPYTKILSF